MIRETHVLTVIGGAPGPSAEVVELAVVPKHLTNESDDEQGRALAVFLMAHVTTEVIQNAMVQIFESTSLLDTTQNRLEEVIERFAPVIGSEIADNLLEEITELDPSELTPAQAAIAFLSIEERFDYAVAAALMPQADHESHEELVAAE